MKISNLGVIKSVDIELKKLLIFTGENNTGKTHTSYMLYGIINDILDSDDIKIINIDNIKEKVDENNSLEQGNIENSIILKYSKEDIEKNLIKELKKIVLNRYRKIASENFKLNEKNFSKLKVDISDSEIKYIVGDIFSYDERRARVNGIDVKINNIDDDTIEIIIKNLDEFENILKNEKIHFWEFFEESLYRLIVKRPKVIYFPAERIGINVFRNELNGNRLKTFDVLRETIEYANLYSDRDRIEKSRELLKKNFELIGSESPYPKPIADYIRFLGNIRKNYENNDNDISNYLREYMLNGKYEIDQDGDVKFREKYGKGTRYRKPIPFHIASSSVKSLFGLDYYIDRLCSENDFLIFDEPELSLHLSNQIKLATVFEKLVDKGVKIIISTHSDMLIRALVNKILSRKTDISDKDIGIYTFKRNTNILELGQLSELKRIETFDEIIEEVDDEYYRLLDN